MIFNTFVDYPTLMLKSSFKDFLSSMIAKAKKKQLKFVKIAVLCSNLYSRIKKIIFFWIE